MAKKLMMNNYNNGDKSNRIYFIVNAKIEIGNNIYAIDNSEGNWSTMTFALDENKIVAGKTYNLFVKVHERNLVDGYILDYPSRSWSILNGYAKLDAVKTVPVGEYFSATYTLNKNSGVFVSFQLSPKGGIGSRLAVECWCEEVV